MSQIRRIADNVTIDVAEYPEWRGEIWECGDQRFVDHTGALYAAVGTEPYPSLPVNGGHFYSLFSNRQQRDIEASTDPVVIQFLLNVNKIIAASAAGATIDLGSTSVQEGLGYLATTDVMPVPQAGDPPTDAPRKYIGAGDVARISTNILP